MTSPARRSPRGVSGDPLTATRAAFIVTGAWYGTLAVVAADIEHDLSLSHGGYAVLLAVTLSVTGLGSIIGGRLIERAGLARTLTMILVLQGASMVAAGTVGGTLFEITFVLVALAGGVTNTVMNTALVAARRGQAGPIVRFHAWWNVGALVGAALVGALAAIDRDWTASWLIIGVATLLVATVSAQMPPPPLEASRPSTDATPTLARGTLIVLAGLYILETAIEASVDTWGVLALRERLAVSALLGAGAFVVGQALAVLARSAFGSLARVAARAAGLAALIAAVGLAVLGTTSSSIAATAGLTAAVMAMAVCGPLLLARLASDAERPAQAIATMQGVGFIGFVAGPTLVGVLADTHGLDRGMVAVAVAALVLAGGSWLTRPPRAATAGPSGRERKRNELADRAGAEH